MTNQTPISLERTSDGRRHFVRLANGQTRFIGSGDVDEWRKRIARTGGHVAKTAATKKVASKRHSITTSASTTTLRMSARPELDYDDRELGWILRGLIEAARGGVREDPRRIFERRDDDDDARERAHNAKLLELGNELFGLLGAATAYFRVTGPEWTTWFSRISSPSSSMMGASAMGLPFAQPMASVSADPLVWLAPVQGTITSRFGPRSGKTHEGIDVAVPVGTQVRAPTTMRIKKVATSDSAGLHVVGEVMRADGRFDGDGLRVKLMHLSQALVKEGDVVQRGQVTGLSGNTGHTTGPHLHLEVVQLTDRSGVIYNPDWIDSETPIDPLSIIPEASFSTSGVVSPSSTAQAPASEGDFDLGEMTKDALQVLGPLLGLAAPIVGLIPGAQPVAAGLLAVSTAAGATGGVMDLLDGPEAAPAS